MLKAYIAFHAIKHTVEWLGALEVKPGAIQHPGSPTDTGSPGPDSLRPRSEGDGQAGWRKHMSRQMNPWVW